ncbi:MAG: nucleoside kinase [Prolixibacteraceae bacterium]|jgi:uridine kinase|nr:nucleoside kinase [Prolixibacteraceae bacterium]
MKNLEIYCVNTGTSDIFPLGTTLSEIANKMGISLVGPICGAYVNNRVKPMDFELVKPKRIEFFDYANRDGQRLYLRSLSFILYAAVKNLWPEAKLKIDHAISKGYYCRIEDLDHPIIDEDIWLIKEEMKNLIYQNLPIERKALPTEKAIELYEQEGLTRKAELFKGYGRLYAPIFELGGHYNFFYGHQLISTGLVGKFGLEKYFDGLLLRFPRQNDMDELEPAIEQEKLFGIFREHKQRTALLGVNDISHLNQMTASGRAGDVIKVSEALHEKKIAEIASTITERHDKVNLVLIAGPSSSGKTTFSKRLSVQLAVNGLHAIQISLDDFFVDRDHTPLDENGAFDFEALEAIDIKYFNQILVKLMNGERVEMPRFDFQSGERTFKDEFLQMDKDHILIIEGIHGLNPGLIPMIEPEKCYKIFISALTQISIDEHTYVPTTDNRLLRRMIRDAKYRGYSASTTIQRWPSVRRGEEKYIFPYQENADIIFNSALVYELAVLKRYANILLKTVKENEVQYSEAARLIVFISYFSFIPETEIPPTSVLREFLGGSSFDY